MLREVKLALLEADVNYKIVKEFINTIQEKALGQDVLKSLTPGQQVVKIVKDELVELLGGKDNILDTEVEMSRFKVTLKDISKANKEGIIKLGAKGVVEIDDQLKIILGNNAKKLKKYIDDLK